MDLLIVVKNWGDKINIKENECEYITMRGKLSGYDELRKT
jgi:hypothetical protein